MRSLAQAGDGDRLAEAHLLACPQGLQSDTRLEEQHDGRAEVKRHELGPSLDRQGGRIAPLLDARAQGQAIALSVQEGGEEFFPGRVSETFGYDGSYLGPGHGVRLGDGVLLFLMRVRDADAPSEGIETLTFFDAYDWDAVLIEDVAEQRLRYSNVCRILRTDSATIVQTPYSRQARDLLELCP